MLFRKFWTRMSRRGISAAAMIAGGIAVLPGSAAFAQPRFDDPLPGLNAAQISAFNDGKKSGGPFWLEGAASNVTFVRGGCLSE